MTTETYARLTLKNAYKKLAFFKKVWFLLPKTSHWELFGDGYCLQSILENFFTCKKFSNFQKCAFTDKEFRSLRRANKGSAFRIRHLLKKVDENFYFRTQTTRLCAVGETVSSFKLVIYQSNQNRPRRAWCPKAQ